MPDSGGGHHGRDAENARSVHVRPVLEQQRHGLVVAGFRGDVQRRRPGAHDEHVGTAVREPAIPGLVAQRRLVLQAHVHVGAALEQQARDVETGVRVERRQVAAPAVGNAIELDREIQRAPAPPVPLIDIRAALDELDGRIELPVVQSKHERRHAIRIGEIDIASTADERLDARDTALARRVEQRREPARLHDLDARLRRHPPLPVVHSAARIDGRPALDQQPNHAGMLLRRRPHQRRLPAEGFACIHARAMLEQHARRIDAPRARNDHQRRLPLGIRRLDIRPRLDQRANNRGVRLDRRRRERRHAIIIRRIRIRAARQQLHDELTIPTMRRPNQRRRAIRPPRIDVSPILERPQRRLALPKLHELRQRLRRKARACERAEDDSEENHRT